MFKKFLEKWGGAGLALGENLKKSPKSVVGNPARIKPRLRSLNIDLDSGRSVTGYDTYRARLELYRFMRDNVPALSAVIWTWVRLCASKSEIQIGGDVSPEQEREIRSILGSLDGRVFRNGLMKRGGYCELMLQFFESLFTDGAVCGELQLSPLKREVDRFLLADLKTIAVEPEGESYKLFQVDDEKKTLLNNDTIFYYSLGTQPGSVDGSSLLRSIPFVAQVEQRLVSDMYRSMKNAGYNRIHVQISPPEKRSDESDSDYISRANSYFDDTVEMMRDFGPDKNPVTWNDVKIEYIGPTSKTSSSTSWYMNHKAMIEDICAGTNLAPFMLGYAYGTTHNWAEFKYELVQRQVATVQAAAASLLDWIAGIELALHGVVAEVHYRFENRADFGISERAQTEKIQIDNIITKLSNKLITQEQAVRELERLG